MKKKLMVLGMVIVLAVSLLCGCKIKNYDSALININSGEDKITLGYGNFVFKYNQARYDLEYGNQYGASMWTQDMTGSGTTFADEVKDNVIETMEQQYAIRKNAGAYGVTLTDEDNKKIEEATNKFLSDNTSSTLNAMGADYDVVKEFFTNLTYVSKMQQVLTKQGKDTGAINDNTTSTSYISTIVSDWKNSIDFKVNDELLAQIQVGDMFKSASSSSGNSTKTNSSAK